MMSHDDFDAGKVANLGWRQGSVLGPELTKLAIALAPKPVDPSAESWFVVTTHDCDVVNGSLVKEPFVEVLRAAVCADSDLDKLAVGGRHVRALQMKFETEEQTRVLSFSVHERWGLPREALMVEAPRHLLPTKDRRLVAEWLAKRYIRAAFPTAFDQRWHAKMSNWLKLLHRYSEWIQGIYLRLNSVEELSEDQPYSCSLKVALAHKTADDEGWSAAREKIEEEVEGFWSQFSPQIKCDSVDVLGTHEITLADLERYQRFDADWVSFSDDTDTTPIELDMQL